MELTDLPPEITHRYLQELDVRSLVAYCDTAISRAAFCTDSYLWSEKIRTVSRKELQDEWFLPLAQENALDLLEALCVALDLEQVWYRIDEHAIVLSIVYLATNRQQGQPSKLESYLTKKLFPPSMSSKDRAERRLFYFGNEGWNVDDYVNDLNDDIGIDIERATQSEELFNYRTLSDSSVLRRHERSYIALSLMTEADIDVDDFPSASSFLNEMIIRPDGAYYLLITLEYFILPLLMAKEEIAELQIYLKDSRARSFTLQRVLGQSAQPDAELDIEDRFTTILVSEANINVFQQLKERLNVDFESLFEINHLYECHDVDLYKEIVGLVDDKENVLAAGFACMEPEEWLDWLNTLQISPLSRNRVITTAHNLASREGYSYFARVV